MIMKIILLALASSSALLAASVSAFSPATTKLPTAAASTRSSTQLYQFATSQQGVIDVNDIYSPRDVYAMEQWATQYGMQKAAGVELYSDDGGNDYQLMTQSGCAAGETVVFVPNSICLNSIAAQQEFGASLQQAEAVVVQIDQGTQFRLPLFRLMVKILVEWEKGAQSLYYPWLNALPRQFYNGVSMTKACFDCLPPYAGWLTSNERINFVNFHAALRQISRMDAGPLSRDTILQKKVVRWAYNVALTRFHEVWQPERAKLIGPMADYLNHSYEPNCEITVDYEGNMNVVALYQIPAGSPLTVSLGDPTNPTPIFAKYGFLPQDCVTIFCKAMHLYPQMQELGYDFKDVLFQTETGEIAPPVWDIFLYDILQKNDPNAAQQFYMACQNNDEGTKEQYKGEYFAYTLEALKLHVYSILSDAENLTMKAQSYDINLHPRVPVIVAHNQLVSQTFTMTAALLEQMG